MKIGRLLALQKPSQNPLSLAYNFGDEFLCTHNKIFRNIRTKALDLGYQFKPDRNDAYLALPLSQLDSILNSKIIPFVDNVSVLKEVESKIKAGAYWDEVCDNLKKNHVFHESCHSVARDVINRTIGQDLNVLSILLEESFSNTCELLSVIDVDSAGHMIFFEFNSYVCEFEERANLARCQSELEPKVMFQFFLLSYLHSNFLRDDLDDRVLGDVVAFLESQNQISKIEPKTLKSLKVLSRISFRLNPRFRQVTTHFYLKLKGFNKPLDELLDFDFFTQIKNSSNYQLAIKELSEIAVL